MISARVDRRGATVSGTASSDGLAGRHPGAHGVTLFAAPASPSSG